MSLNKLNPDMLSIMYLCVWYLDINEYVTTIQTIIDSEINEVKSNLFPLFLHQNHITLSIQSYNETAKLKDMFWQCII